MFFNKSQTATEYLIILATVIILSLVVVSILGDVPVFSANVDDSSNQLYLSSLPVGITSHVVSPFKTTILLQNNLPSTVRVTNISINNEICISDDLTNPTYETWVIVSGGSRQISCINIAANSIRYEYPIRMTYTNLESGANFTINSTQAVLSGMAGYNNCPEGYIPIPGSDTFGTNDFCVMQYEAKADGSSNCVGGDTDECPVSDAEGTPWVFISQENAIVECESVGAKLMTNNHWMTIARNIENVADNWNSSIVGVGSIKKGNTGQVVAGIEYNGDNPADRSTDTNSLAELKLSNGQSIWDLSGNVYEYIDLSCTNPPWEYFIWDSWSDLHLADFEKIYSGPSGPYDDNQGMGLYSGCQNNGTITVRGGYWSEGGIYHKYMGLPNNLDILDFTGFRCVYEFDN